MVRLLSIWSPDSRYSSVTYQAPYPTVTSRGIRYHKIFVEGHEVPHIRHVKEFNQVVNEVREQDPGKCV
ncbi:hypothetical protein FBUS_07096 [Fasciolopsis buskii]|uniref:Uncharacterized protein n=1 Tax=Fasciolopsis buskii TaxID=27845 RepID=A0A8E0S665_9TREM|nr:hypothetical protein FBUS_07096 [Fasciolopsis buski]